MRILVISALLVATASCAWPPPPQAETAGAAPPPPVAPVFYVPNPLAFLFAPVLLGAPPPGRLTLSNFSYDHAHIQAVITPYPDCAAREGTAPSDFMLPLNGTRVIEAAPGTDVCWRREVEPQTAQGAAPSTPGWTEWNRVFLSSTAAVDTRL